MLRDNELQDNSTSEPSAFQKELLLLGVGTGVLLFGLDANIVNLALPTLVSAFDTDFATIQWVVLSYVLMSAVFVLGVAKLGDMWSKKRVYLGGLLLFSLSSLLCGLAPTIEVLIGCRVLQGLGAVLMSAIGTAIITEVFPKEERGRGLGILVGIFTAGVTLGPTVGGLLISLWNWRLIFLLNVPLGLFASLVLARFSPPSVPNQEIKQQFDLLGALLMTITLTCFALCLTLVQQQGFGSTAALILLVLAVIGLVGFLGVESRVPEPMLNLTLFRSLPLSLSLLLSWLYYMVLAGLNLILPFFLEFVKQYPAYQVGLLMAFISLLNSLTTPIWGTLSDRFGTQIIRFVGLVLIAGGCLGISTFDVDLTRLGYVGRVTLLGIGQGMFSAPNQSRVMGAVPREQVGIASGLLSLSRTLGLMTGFLLIGTLFSNLTMAGTLTASPVDMTTISLGKLVFGVQTTFRIIAITVIMLTVFTFFLDWLYQTKPDLSSDALSELR